MYMVEILLQQNTILTIIHLLSEMNKEIFWKGLQVKPDPFYGYRLKVVKYEILEDVYVPSGKALANTNLGPGGYCYC